MNRLEQISKLLLEEIQERFNKEPLNIDGLEFSESYPEMLDKFIVQHIRMWKMEDMIGESKDNNEIADLKKKVDYLFKDRRPKLWRAIGLYLDAHISKNHFIPIAEQNVKLYKGYKN